MKNDTTNSISGDTGSFFVMRDPVITYDHMTKKTEIKYFRLQQPATITHLAIELTAIGALFSILTWASL